MESRKKAAALSYKPDKDVAPKIVAKGSGAIAEKILQIAREHSIPLKEDQQLVEVLSTLDLYQEIPPELYRAVAEILAFIYSMTVPIQVGTKAQSAKGTKNSSVTSYQLPVIG